MIIDLNNRVKVIRPEAVAVFPYSNSLFINDDIRVMVDAGAGGKAYLPIKSNSIDLLLITHNHFDHVNGLSLFTNAQIMAGQEEAEGYSSPEVYSNWAGYSKWEKLMGRTKIERFSQTIPMPDDVPIEPGFQKVDLAGVIKDNKVFDLGKTKLTALHTPGHSHGHYAFFIEKEGILFSGDVDISPRGPWYGGEHSDFDALVASVERLIELQPNILVTSHRRVFDSKSENIAKLFKDFIGIALQKEEKIYDYLTTPRSINDISEQDFTKDYPRKTAYAEFWAKMMIMRHLERLQKNARIIKIDQEHYVRA